MSLRSEEISANYTALKNHCAVLKADQKILMEQFAIQRERYYRERQAFALRVEVMRSRSSETGVENE